MTEPDTQRARAAALNLHGLLAHWNEVAAEPWVTPLLGWRNMNAPAVVWSGAPARPISAGSNRFATSTGPGRSAATAPRSTR